MTRLNVFADEPWDRTAEQMRIRTRFFGMPLGAKELGASLHELLPGSTGYHLHAHYEPDRCARARARRLDPADTGGRRLSRDRQGRRRDAHPLEPAPAGEDPGIVATFDIPPQK